MGYWNSYKENLYIGRAVLPHRYLLFGLVIPTFWTVYLCAISIGVMARPEGAIVDWWVGNVTESFAVVRKTESTLVERGVSKQIRDFALFAYSALIFNIVLNFLIQSIICFFAKSDNAAARAFVISIRKNLKLDPRFYFGMSFVFFASLLYFFVFHFGFELLSFRSRDSIVEIYFLTNFILFAGLQYFLGAVVMIAVVFLREKLM